MVSTTVLVAVIATIAIGAILIIIFAYSFSFSQSSEHEAPLEQQENHVVITSKTYPAETWGNAQGFDFTANKSFSITTTLTLDYCVRAKEQHFVMVPGVDSVNPVILKRNGDEVSIPFCLTSFDVEPVTWQLMARDNRYDPDIREFDIPDLRIFEHGALGDGVNLSFDKSAISFPGYQFNVNDVQQYSGNFTLFLDTDSNTKLGDKGFYLMAIRHLDDIDREVQVSDIIVYVRVVE